MTDGVGRPLEWSGRWVQDGDGSQRPEEKMMGAVVAKHHPPAGKTVIRIR